MGTQLFSKVSSNIKRIKKIRGFFPKLLIGALKT